MSCTIASWVLLECGPPWASRLWNFDPVARLRGLPRVMKVNFGMSMCGTAHREPVRPLANVETLHGLGDRPRA
eukprot:3566073-Pyramimonas_sp.AAC.1